MLAQITDGAVARVGLPRTGFLSDGRGLTNYRQRLTDNPGLAYDEGWRDVVDDGPPEHDPATHRSRRLGHVYDPEGDVVNVVYEVVERPPDPDAGEHLDPQIGEPHA